MKKKTALDSFTGTVGEISALLNKLQEAVVDNHMGVAPEAVNWGHAGTAQHILEMLNEVAAAAGIRSEK